MRLTHSQRFELREFVRNWIPKCVILSHMWGEEEVSFEDIRNGTAKKRKEYDELKGAYEQASRDEYELIWIDTCCSI
jgi:hypothetical protein